MQSKENRAEVSFRTIDPTQYPKHFESVQREKHWDLKWQELGIYRWNPEVRREETFVVDTPPPTVSGSLHIGHVFSYTHTDVIVRQARMAGKNIFYPMGWDDNGLPTERRVQNYFHVRCDPSKAYEKNLQLEQASAKQRKERARLVSRENFIELCQQVTHEDEKVFMELFKRVGLSVDWSQVYSTIDPHCRKTAQYSFIDLYKKGSIYQSDAPSMWDVDFQTAVAQAEVEDRPQTGAFHHIEFAVESSDKTFSIATTRPELLPACIGVTAHPEDTRYKDLFGKNAITPLFGVPVRIFPSELADPEKGTGILMVCSFGDATDVQWWREQTLPLRQIIERNGCLKSVRFGEPDWPSLDADKANRFYQELAGKNTKQAKLKIVELLRSADSEARSGLGPALKQEPVAVQQNVKFYEKGDRPLEFVSTRQWFVRLLDEKNRLIDFGKQISWHPEHMRSRFQNWTENLAIDWCISRQRYFGVPFPLWYKIDSSGQILYDQVLIADEASLPVDPLIHCPKGFDESQRNKPDGFSAAEDVFDTWFTSSLTPQISSHWIQDQKRHSKLFPADLRPQGHDIIRTWAFYTIAKAMLHEDQVPWKHIALSGWILDPDRKKMSKSKGNVVTPLHLLDDYGSDAVRYWAASARLGADTAFDERVLKIGRRLSTKIYNASKFVLSQTDSSAATGSGHFLSQVTEELDLAFLAEMKKLLEKVEESFSQMNYAQALQDIERFFWTCFTDSYIELVKARCKDSPHFSSAQRASALNCLRGSLQIILRLFAPFMPYVTEEIWSWSYANDEQSSIHTQKWPRASELNQIANTPLNYEILRSAFSAILKYKSENSLPVGAEITEKIQLLGSSKDLDSLRGVQNDLIQSAKALNLHFETSDEVESGSFIVRK